MEQAKCEVCGRGIFKTGNYDFYVCPSCIENVPAEDIFHLDIVEV